MDPPNPVPLLGITRESGEAKRTESRRGRACLPGAERRGARELEHSCGGRGGREWSRLRETLAPGSVSWRRWARAAALAGLDPGSGGGRRGGRNPNHLGGGATWPRLRLRGFAGGHGAE
jgi:hypothetical protein